MDRFDRVGEMGRSAVVILAAASERVHDTWTDSAEEMHRRDELSDESLRRIALLDAYGALIANTDRHHYNVSMFPTQNGYDVAPAFDQLPMAYAPPASGNLINAAISRPRAAVNTLDVWDEARGPANDFWRRAGQQELTGSMQRIVRAHSRR